MSGYLFCFIAISAIIIFILLIDLACAGMDSILCKPFYKKYKYNKNMNCDNVFRKYHVPSHNNLWTYPSSIYKKLNEFPSISFSKFYDFYCINPNSWTMEKYRVYKDNRDDLTFVFEYDEWKKYDKWYKQLLKEKEQIAINKKNQKIMMDKNETTKKILESVQKDIDAVRKESEKNMKEACELIKECKW